MSLIDRSTATPVTSFFAESLDGLPYIRISDDQPKFLNVRNIPTYHLIFRLEIWKQTK